MVCLGFEHRTPGLLVQMDPLSYGGRPQTVAHLMWSVPVFKMINEDSNFPSRSKRLKAAKFCRASPSFVLGASFCAQQIVHNKTIKFYFKTLFVLRQMTFPHSNLTPKYFNLTKPNQYLSHSLYLGSSVFGKTILLMWEIISEWHAWAALNFVNELGFRIVLGPT